MLLTMMIKNDSIGTNNTSISDTEDDMNDEQTLQGHLLCGFFGLVWCSTDQRPLFFSFRKEI